MHIHRFGTIVLVFILDCCESLGPQPEVSEPAFDADQAEQVMDQISQLLKAVRM